MTADQYLWNILSRERVDTGPQSPVRSVIATLRPLIEQWASGYLVDMRPSGSFAKGTANHSGTDIDLFISLSSHTPKTLKEIYNLLFDRLREAGYQPRRQNVSIGLRVGSYDVDLVPGRKQDQYGGDHSLYRSKADTWTKTNVDTHIALVSRCGRQNEIRTLKLWRTQKSLDFPSFYLELVAIEALRGNATNSLSTNVWRVFEYLRDNFVSAAYTDPANTNNKISDDLTYNERVLIKAAAVTALAAKNWGQIVT